jgi:hypothetical protein
MFLVFLWNIGFFLIVLALHSTLLSISLFTLAFPLFYLVSFQVLSVASCMEGSSSLPLRRTCLHYMP